VADALSAASEAWDAAGAVVAATPAPVADAASTVAHAVAEGPWLDPKTSIIPYNSPLATWFRQTFMDGIFASFDYGFFQAFVVVVELLIGLAIFGGLFTWGAALVSIGLCLAFTLSGIFAWNQLWFVFAAILMLGGAGRSLGLDHWFVPFVKKLWKRTRFAKRHRLYTGEASK
jgi:NADH dehydrogenase